MATLEIKTEYRGKGLNTLELVDEHDEFNRAMWDHCTAGFDNREFVRDGKKNRALLAMMFEAHNVSLIFVTPLKKKGK